MTMDKKRAQEILGGALQDDGSIQTFGNETNLEYAHWLSHETAITLDGNFELEELEAIVWAMKNKPA